MRYGGYLRGVKTRCIPTSSKRPCGKESTEVRITQNKGRKVKTLTKNRRDYGWQEQKSTRQQNWNIATDTAVFFNQKRANECEHMKNMVSLEFLKGATRGLREEWMEGNLKGDYLRLIPGLCLEDRTNWYASSRWQRVIWLVLGDRLWSTCTFQFLRFLKYFHSIQ